MGRSRLWFALMEGLYAYVYRRRRPNNQLGCCGIFFFGLIAIVIAIGFCYNAGIFSN